MVSFNVLIMIGFVVNQYKFSKILPNVLLNGGKVTVQSNSEQKTRKLFGFCSEFDCFCNSLTW